MSVSESSDEAVGMEPLVLEMSESDDEEVLGENVKVAKAKPTTSISTTDVVLLSSDDCEIVTPPRTPPSLFKEPTTSPATKSKRKYSKRLEVTASADITDSETEEPVYSQTKTKKIKC